FCRRHHHSSGTIMCFFHEMCFFQKLFIAKHVIKNPYAFPSLHLIGLQKPLDELLFLPNRDICGHWPTSFHSNDCCQSNHSGFSGSRTCSSLMISRARSLFPSSIKKRANFSRKFGSS